MLKIDKKMIVNKYIDIFGHAFSHLNVSNNIRYFLLNNQNSKF